MDANTIFNNIMLQIESSNLNYSITKTPFSASISIKASFVKRFQNCEERQVQGMTQMIKKELQSEKKNEELKLVLSQKTNIEASLKSEQLKVEVLESQLNDLKEEIKREKSKFNSKFKNQVSEITGMSMAVKNLEEKLEVKVKALKVKDEACKEFKKAKADSEKKLGESLLDLENEKRKGVKKFLCDLCDCKVESSVRLKEHVRIYHSKDQRSQTSFDGKEINVVDCEYSCFYCDKEINSNQDLQCHKRECHEQWLSNSDFVAKCELLKDASDLQEYQSICSQEEDFNPFQCSDCGVECDDKYNLDGHISTYHEIGTFQCDICPLKFPTNGHLYFHKLNCHEDE